MTTEISQEQFNQMVQGSLATGYQYAGDTFKKHAIARVEQMLSRAGITVKEPFVPLDIPEVGRKVHATLRNGDNLTGKVSRRELALSGGYKSFRVDGVLVFINLLEVAKEDPCDVIAWEYVKEWTVSQPDPYTGVIVVQFDGRVNSTFRSREDAQAFVKMKNKGAK